MLTWTNQYIDLGQRNYTGPIHRDVAELGDLRFDLEIGPGFWPIYIGRISQGPHGRRTLIAEQAFANSDEVRAWCEAFAEQRVAA